MIFTGRVNNQPRRVVAVGNKAGHWFLYDAKSGDPIYETVKVLDTDNHPPLEQGKAVEVVPVRTGRLQLRAYVLRSGHQLCAG